jgi:hypothetical protein
MKAIVAALLLAACSSSGGSNQGDHPDAPDGTIDGAENPIDGPVGTSERTIYTIVLENHDYAEIIGSPNAPYINSLIAQYGLATEYYDTIHPSLGNYLHMISGENQYPGVVDLNPTTFPFPVDKPNLGTQLEAAQIKWRSYQESMGTPCKLAGSGKYAPKHDPFLYFTDQQKAPNNLCKDTNVDYTQFAADLATNQYRYMWITPNLDSDGHDPQSNPVQGLQTSDTWMSHEVPKILASDGFKNGGVLFITWDEAEGRNGDDGDKIPMIVVSPRVKSAGMKSATHFTHASYLATVEDMLSLPRLATVTTTPNLMEFLNP